MNYKDYEQKAEKLKNEFLKKYGIRYNQTPTDKQELEIGLDDANIRKDFYEDISVIKNCIKKLRIRNYPHWIHLILTLITAGHWILVWILMYIFRNNINRILNIKIRYN